MRLGLFDTLPKKTRWEPGKICSTNIDYWIVTTSYNNNNNNNNNNNTFNLDTPFKTPKVTLQISTKSNQIKVITAIKCCDQMHDAIKFRCGQQKVWRPFHPLFLHTGQHVNGLNRCLIVIEYHHPYPRVPALKHIAITKNVHNKSKLIKISQISIMINLIIFQI